MVKHRKSKPSQVNSNDFKGGYYKAFLRDVEIEVSVGLHPWEKHPERPTRIIVNIELWGKKISGPEIKNISLIDYDLIRNELKSWTHKKHTDLLETLAEKIFTFVFKQEQVAACLVRIEKPDIFNEVGSAGIELYRVR